MHITALFRDRETGEIKAATIWAHRIVLSGIDLDLAIHPRYCLTNEGEVVRSWTGEYCLSEVITGYVIMSSDSAKLLIEAFVMRAYQFESWLEKIKTQLDDIKNNPATPQEDGSWVSGGDFSNRFNRRSAKR